MAQEQQGDHRIFQEQSRCPLKYSEQFQSVNDAHTSTIERVCLGVTPISSVCPLTDAMR
jgi:hypothetical protein